MIRKKSQTTPRVEGELKMRIIDVLSNAEDGDTPTLEWIKSQDMILSPYSTQKLSRLLGTLVEMGLVKKGKSRSLGRMVYRLTAKMEADGYDVEEEQGFGVPARAWNGLDWELEDMLNQQKEEDYED